MSGLKNMKQTLFQDKFYNAEYKILTDMRLSNNNLSVEEVEEFGKWIGEQLKLGSFNLNAILTSTPQQVVQSSIFSSNKNLKKNNYKVFSTLEGSLNYLHIDFSNIEIIKTEINKMKEILPIKSVF